MLYSIAAYIFSRNPKYLSILKKSELGVYFFCRKVAIECEKHGYREIALQLKKQAEAEYNHAQAFNRLLGNKFTESYKNLERRGDRTIDWSRIDWDTSGGKYIATNLSNNSISKLFFKNKNADEYSIFDKLAFMQVLECHQARFYEALLKFVPPTVQLMLERIIEDEKEHSWRLNVNIFDILPSKWASRYLDKWRIRAWRTLLYLPFFLFRDV